MAELNIRGRSVDVDIIAELEEFEWTRPRWSGDKLLAASPFRHDNTPSFFVRLAPYGDLPAGVWSDAGAYDDEWRSGNFAKLLSFLRNETYEEAEDYLLAKYDFSAEAGDAIKLPRLNLAVERNRQALDEAAILAGYGEGPGAYLLSRGITAEVQREYGTLDGGNRAVIPWRNAGGKLQNVKYRATAGKLFWYESGGVPIRELVYGLDVIWRLRAQTAVLCEAEIDAMSWRVAGMAALAVGGVAFNRRKAELIAGSPVSELIIAADNDKAGEKLREEVSRALGGYMRIRQAYVPADVKDANEALTKLGADSLRRAAEAALLGKYVNLRSLSRRVT